MHAEIVYVFMEPFALNLNDIIVKQQFQLKEHIKCNTLLES